MGAVRWSHPRADSYRRGCGRRERAIRRFAAGICALGAAASLALALLAGKKVFALMKRSLGAEEWIRRGLGVAVLIGVVAIAFGWDRGLLTRVSLGEHGRRGAKLLDRFHPARSKRTQRAIVRPRQAAR